MSHLEAADRSPSGRTPVRWLMVWAPGGHRKQQHRLAALSSAGSRLCVRLARWIKTTPLWESPASSATVKVTTQSLGQDLCGAEEVCIVVRPPVDSQRLRTLAKPASDWRGNREAHIWRRAEPPGSSLTTGPIPSQRLWLSGR